MKENVSGCIFSEHSVQLRLTAKQPLSTASRKSDRIRSMAHSYEWNLLYTDCWLGWCFLVFHFLFH